MKIENYQMKIPKNNCNEHKSSHPRSGFGPDSDWLMGQSSECYINACKITGQL